MVISALDISRSFTKGLLEVAELLNGIGAGLR
jgi:hypothetical protein